MIAQCSLLLYGRLYINSVIHYLVLSTIEFTHRVFNSSLSLKMMTVVKLRI